MAAWQDTSHSSAGARHASGLFVRHDAELVEVVRTEDSFGMHTGEAVVQTISNDLFIKIQIDGKIISQCVQFKHYLQWYDAVYRAKPVPIKESVKAEIIDISVGRLALNKA